MRRIGLAVRREQLTRLYLCYHNHREQPAARDRELCRAGLSVWQGARGRMPGARGQKG
jgi:hypothetical protein